MADKSLPPHDAQAERDALACALEKPELFSQLQERHFYDQHNLVLFRAGTRIEIDSGSFNPADLLQRLKDDGELESVGGFEAITALTVPSAANFPSYLSTLEDRAERRAAIAEAEKAISQARNIRVAFLPRSSGPSLIQRLDDRVFLPTVKPIEPPPRFLLAGVGVCTEGNLTTVSAQAKHGKSAGVGAMMASTFAGSGCDCLNWKSENTASLAVVHLDTEQSRFDHWQLIDRAVRRAGLDAAPEWLRSYCVTGFSISDIRQSIWLSLEQTAQKFGGVHSFILDGAADCVADVNDPAESNDFVAELHALAIQYSCPIITVIHLNPGSEFKTRGHLGSQLERKAETNLKLEKDENGVTVIWADKNRRAPILKKTAPRFTWCDEARMHVSVASNGQADRAKAIEELRDQIQEAFRITGKTSLTWTDTVNALLRAPGINSKRTAERVFTNAKECGVIRKNIIHQWELA
jgi:hypothetical protein